MDIFKEEGKIITSQSESSIFYCSSNQIMVHICQAGALSASWSAWLLLHKSLLRLDGYQGLTCNSQSTGNVIRVVICCYVINMIYTTPRHLVSLLHGSTTHNMIYTRPRHLVGLLHGSATHNISAMMIWLYFAFKSDCQRSRFQKSFFYLDKS